MTGDAGGRSAAGGTVAAGVGTKGSALLDIHQALTLDFTYNRDPKQDIWQAFASICNSNSSLMFLVYACVCFI